MLILAILISAVLSYLLGSFNSSILVVRLLKHQDIREFGSHNAGLTNTLRCFGKGCAALTLVGDLAKGIVAVLLSKGICELLGTGLTAQNDVHFIGYIAGIFAILGHVFPIYYHFKGGKGVLVGVSVFLGIDWKVFLCLIVIFAVVLAISKYVSLGSIIAAACCPVVTFLFQFWQRGDLPMWYLCLNTAGFSLNINCMYQKFITVITQLFHRFQSYCHICKFLPPVCNYIISVISSTAAEVKYKMFFSYSFYHPVKIFPVKLSITENIGSYYYVACSRIQIFFCIFRSDTTAQLKPSRISVKCLQSLFSG